MAVKFRRRGSGITERQELHLTGSAKDIADTLRHAAKRTSFEGWLLEVESHERAVLKRAGHDPDHPGRVKADEDTAEDFAARILRRVQILRGAMRRRKISEAAEEGVMLGQLVCERGMKAGWETPALIGEKYLLFGHQGGRPRNIERNVALARKYQQRQLTSRMSKTALMTLIGKEAVPPLARYASIEAIKAGLKELKKSSGKPALPDD
jgi:hypothetical protein